MQLFWDRQTGRFVALAAALSLMLGGGVVTGQDQDAATLFDEVYGKDYKAARASASTDDDAALAAQLRDAIKQFDLPVPMVVYMGDKVIELTKQTPEGYTVALEAIELVQAKAPAQAAVLADRRIEVLERAYGGAKQVLRNAIARVLIDALVARGDAHMEAKRETAAATDYRRAIAVSRETGSPLSGPIAAKLQKVIDANRLAAEIDALEKRLETDPADANARLRLIEIHLVERDNPVAAVWFLGDGVDDDTRRLLPVAAKNGAGADAQTLADLANWYSDLADKAPPDAKRNLLLRARNYYNQMLADYDRNDFLRARAQLTLEKIETKLKEFEGKAPAHAEADDSPDQPPTTADAMPIGDLTVKISGQPITEESQVRNLYERYWRNIARQYVSVGDDFAPVHFYEDRFPSSKKETVQMATKRLTKVELRRDGLITRRVTVEPVPAEAQAASMALPGLAVGEYGYAHSAQLDKIIDGDEAVISNIWLVDHTTWGSEPYAQTEQRRTLYRQQASVTYRYQPVRVIGLDTRGVSESSRIGMDGLKGKPLRLVIVGSEPNPDRSNLYTRTRLIAVTPESTRITVKEEADFLAILKKRGLTITDFANLVVEGRKASSSNLLEETIKLMENRGGGE